MKSIFCILALLCLYMYGLAQPLPTKKTGISIGDTMPDLLINNLYNYPLKTVPFSAFQQELTIIDFWASWCGSCVASFPKMHALQKKYAGKLQVLMVNGSGKEDASRIPALFKRLKANTGASLALPYLLEDTLFSELFPHQVIPHCVWIGKGGSVVAITDSKDVSEAGIEAVLRGEDHAFAFKNDALLFDAERDDLASTGAGAVDDLLNRSIITAEKKGIGQLVAYEEADEGKVKLMRVLNYSLLHLYQLSNKEVFKYGTDRLLIDSSVAWLFRPGEMDNRLQRYCYELQTRPISRQAMLAWLRADLERYFNVRAVAEERVVDCYVLTAEANLQERALKKKIAGTELVGQARQQDMLGDSRGELWRYLTQVLKVPVLTDPGMVAGYGDFNFPTGFMHYSPEEVAVFLGRQGMQLKPATTRIMVPRLVDMREQHFLPIN